MTWLKSTLAMLAAMIATAASDVAPNASQTRYVPRSRRSFAQYSSLFRISRSKPRSGGS